MNFKFCPQCGGKLVKSLEEKQWRLVCLRCKFVFYQNSKPTASVILINKESKVLLAKRGFSPKKGFWDCVGGFLENGEDPVKGIKREVKEELDVEIKIKKLLGIFIDSYKEKNLKYFTLNIYYLGEIIKGEPKPMSDIIDFRWFSKKEIPFEKLAFKNNREALRLWLKQN